MALVGPTGIRLWERVAFAAASSAAALSNARIRARLLILAGLGISCCEEAPSPEGDSETSIGSSLTIVGAFAGFTNV